MPLIYSAPPLTNAQAKEITEIEVHLHSFERWFETAAVPSGETHVADRIGDGSGAFQIDAGNDDWGAWIQILGSSDTPFEAGKTFFDLNEVDFSDAERDEVYFFQIAFGNDPAVALANHLVSEEVFKPSSNQVDSGAKVFQGERQLAGTKVWARCKCPGQNTATLDFYFGIHEYDE